MPLVSKIDSKDVAKVMLENAIQITPKTNTDALYQQNILPHDDIKAQAALLNG